MNLATSSPQWNAIFYSGRKIAGGIRSHKEAQKAHKPNSFAPLAPFCGLLHLVVPSHFFQGIPIGNRETREKHQVLWLNSLFNLKKAIEPQINDHGPR